MDWDLELNELLRVFIESGFSEEIEEQVRFHMRQRPEFVANFDRVTFMKDPALREYLGKRMTNKS